MKNKILKFPIRENYVTWLSDVWNQWQWLLFAAKPALDIQKANNEDVE